MKTEILIIGTGTSGYTAAMKLKNAGKSVIIADRRSYGGTCAKRGCQAKKYLVTNTEIVHLAKKLHGNGVAGSTEVKWNELIRLKRGFTNNVSLRTEKSLTDAGIITLHGNAVFNGEKSVYVGKTPVEADKIILAAGSYPRTLNIPGEEMSEDSEYFLDMDELPEKIIFIGGGYISFELACVAKSAGAQVTILHRSQQVLKMFDPDIVNLLVKEMTSDGINIITNHPVEKISRVNRELVVTAGGSDFPADLVINASGRVPDFSTMDLDSGKIKEGPGGIIVDEFLQSVSNKNVYAIGDCAASGPQLAPVADMHADLVSENIINKTVLKADYSAVPSAVFSQPPLAAVGISEKEAKDKDMDVRIKLTDMSFLPSSKRIAQKTSACKIIIDNKSDKILGAHIIGHNSAEVINIFVLAVKFGHTVSDLKSVLWAYPTYCSDVKYILK